MAAPIYSTITLFSELIISSLIGYIFYSGYYRNKFPYRIALAAIAYEVLFNVSYMVYRTFNHGSGQETYSAFKIILAIFHGTLSLIMFVCLIIFLVFAYRNYKRRINYFKKHNYVTLIFLVFWIIAVISGFLFYFLEYII